MVNLRKFRSSTPGVSVGATSAVLALAIMFVLTVGTSQAAHAQTFQLLYTFNGGTEGAEPHAGLTMRGGDLYGTDYAGHSGVNWGSVFELQSSGSGWIFHDLAVFDGTLSSGVTFGPDGSIYGTSPNNLARNNHGYVYNVRPTSAICHSFCKWTSTVLYVFSGGSDGGNPRFGNVTFDQAGNIYGTTYTGGSGNGVVYEMSRSGSRWTEQPIYTFSGPDGANPSNAVIFDSAGNLYGTTTAGGSGGFGTVFELSPSGSGWTEKVLYSFQGGSDGSKPIASLIFDQAGNLYGNTSNGGSAGGGTVFELTPSGGNWTYTLLSSITGGSNCGPWAALALDGAGNLYGTTVCDGALNAGNVFKLTNSGGGWMYSSLHDFTGGSDGSRPYSNVIFDATGNLYGTASHGGGHSQGVAWEITP